MSMDLNIRLAQSNAKQEQLICLANGAIVFLISLIISRMYIGGDQIGYHNAYTALGGLGLGDQSSEIWTIYQTWISSVEPIHVLVSLIGGGLGIEKNLLMSLVNGVIAAYSVRLFLSWGASLGIASGLVLTNYYFYVIYFPAERLKFAFLFLLISLLYSKKPFGFAVNAILAIFSHFSIVLIYFGIWFSRLNKILKKGDDRIGLLIAFLSLVTILAVLVWNFEYLHWKLETYFQKRESLGVFNILPIALLVTFSCLYSKDRWEPLFAFLPIIAGVMIIGGSRLNMLGFFIFLHYGLQHRGGVNVGVVTALLFFFYKGGMFFDQIVTSGQGF